MQGAPSRITPAMRDGPVTGGPSVPQDPNDEAARRIP